MKRFLIASTLLLLGFARAADHPNVLFISVDDWNDWIGIHGNNQAVTPNLDKLAKRGVTFRNAHASAVYCAPSRTSLMTGRNPHTIGAYHDQPHFAEANHPDIKDLSMWFREHGYYTAGGGKIYHHMPGFIDMRGWEEYFHWSDEGKKKAWHLSSWDFGAPLPDEIPSSPIAKYLYEKQLEREPDKEPKKLNSHMEWGILPDEKEEEMADTICANWAADFIKTYQKDQPFFLAFGSYAPHKPNFVPQKYFKMHPLQEVEQPGMHPGDLDDLPPTLRKRMQNRRNHIDVPVRQLKCGKKAVRGYLAALSYTDAMVGRVLDALAASPHADNTVIVLWSDNGYHLGEKGAWAKHTLWERTSNIPFIWAGPGIAKGGVIDTTVSLLDTYPTLTALCGLPSNANNEGVSLSTILAQPESAKDRTVLQGDEAQFALINQHWRYIRTLNDEEQLYDLAKDPGEHTNLSADPAYAEKLAEFRAQLPTEIAKPGLRPKELKLKIDGETFEWKSRK
ncbi:MAG: sulfatase [Verrucomicrobiota bacterium]